MKNSIIRHIMPAVAILLFVNFVNAQIRPVSIAKPTNQNILVNIKQRNLEAEQQAFAKRSNADEVWFYENANYGGRKFILERGSYSLKELGTDLNDFLSSALIPSHLMVVVYANDNFDGDWYILKPDNASNLNFEYAVVSKAKVKERLVSGKTDINDVISSLIIYNPDQDYVLIDDNGKKTVTDVINYDDNLTYYKAFPGPYLNGVDGRNMANLGPLNDKAHWSITLSNNSMSIQIYQDANFKGYQSTLKKEYRDYSILGRSDIQYLQDISLTDGGTVTASIGRDRAWANRISSFKVNIAPGRITEITK